MIELTGVTKTFSYRGTRIDAVSELSFSVPRGEIRALVGPNGAGKTTTLRMLTTLTQPTFGTVKIDGLDIREAARIVRGRLGYVPQKGGLLPEVRVLDELIFQGGLFGMQKAAARSRAMELLSMFELTEVENAQAQRLSGGQRRRIDIALALMNSPRVLLLDEPTVGLDPQSRANLWTHIKMLRASMDVTVLLTTHYLEEAEHLADSISIVDHGHLVADDSPEALISRFAQDTIRIGTPNEPAAALATACLRGRFDASIEGAEVVLKLHDAATAAPEIISALQTAEIDYGRFEVNRAGLDDVFFNLTGRSLRD